MVNKPLIALTGPSNFSGQMKKMIEEYLHFNYVEILHNDENNLNYWINTCDGLILAGGVDLYPPYYGQSLKRGKGLSNFDPQRDKREQYLLEWFSKMEKPVLGICRGFQLICVRNGFEIIPDLSFSNISHSPSADGMKLDRDVIDDAHYFYFTKIKYTKENPPSEFVNSVHHQGIKKPAYDNYKGFNIIGYSETATGKPDLIEWVESENGKIMAVQFHPELAYHQNTLSQSILHKYKSLFC